MPLDLPRLLAHAVGSTTLQVGPETTASASSTVESIGETRETESTYGTDENTATLNIILAIDQGTLWSWNLMMQGNFYFVTVS